MTRARRPIHVADMISAVAAIRLLLARARAGEVASFVALVELPDGSYQAIMTPTANVAERLGRMDILKDQILDEADEDAEPGDG